MNRSSSLDTWSRRAVRLAMLATLVTPSLVLAQDRSSSTPSPKAAADYSREADVIEHARTAWRFAADGTGRKEVSVRVKVQSEASLRAWGQLAFGYNAANERMEVASVRVRKSDGTSVTAPADAVQDLTSAVERLAPVYTDTREKHVTVPGLRPGDVLEYTIVTTIHTALAPGHFWI